MISPHANGENILWMKEVIKWRRNLIHWMTLNGVWDSITRDPVQNHIAINHMGFVWNNTFVCPFIVSIDAKMDEKREPQLFPSSYYHRSSQQPHNTDS